MGKFVPIVLRGFNNFDTAENSNLDGLACEDVSLTVQDGADECDINFIVRKFGITGQLPIALRAPTFGDFVGLKDYQSALNAIQEADDAFMSMPADIRARFDNDAAKFVDFCSDSNNRDEMFKMGLIDSPEKVQVDSSPAPLPVKDAP